MEEELRTCDDGGWRLMVLRSSYRTGASLDEDVRFACNNGGRTQGGEGFIKRGHDRLRWGLDGSIMMEGGGEGKGDLPGRLQ